MILGQAFVYNKLLDKYQFPLPVVDIKNIELLGLRKLTGEEFSNLDQVQANQKLRDFFLEDFGKLLEEEELSFCFKFWQDLSSPITQSSFNFVPYSDFATKLLEWKQANYDIELLADILNEDLSAISQDDFVIYYGLRVLAKLNGAVIIDSEYKEIDIDTTEDDSALEQIQEILVVADNNLAPLFININCQFLDFIPDIKLLLVEIKKCLKINTSLKILIIESYFEPEKIKFLQQNLPELLVTEFDTKTKASGVSFFDDLVKSTLGVKLV